MKTFEHVNDCWEAIEACQTEEEIQTVLDNIPRKFGEQWTDSYKDADGNNICEVTNQWYDEQQCELNTESREFEIEEDEE